MSQTFLGHINRHVPRNIASATQHPPALSPLTMNNVLDALFSATNIGVTWSTASGSQPVRPPLPAPSAQATGSAQTPAAAQPKEGGVAPAPSWHTDHYATNEGLSDPEPPSP